MNKSFVKNVIAVILGIALLIAVYEVFSMLIGAFVVDDALKFSTDGSMNKVIEFTTLEEKQKIVGGLIDFIELEDDVDLIFNELENNASPIERQNTKIRRMTENILLSLYLLVCNGLIINA